MLIATIIGNRPQFVKAAAVSRTLRETRREVLVHTGQAQRLAAELDRWESAR